LELWGYVFKGFSPYNLEFLTDAGLIMHELSDRELFEAIHYAKSIDEETGAKIIQQFQVKQAALSKHVRNVVVCGCACQPVLKPQALL